MVYLKSWFALMLLLSWLTVLSTSGGLSYNKRPSGPKICEKLCRTISECDHFEFSAMHLECIITDANDTRKPDMEHILFYINDKRKFLSRVACPKFRKLINTRSGKVYCDEGIPQKRDKWMRLLVIGRTRPTYETRQVDLRNYTVSSYLLDVKFILAITYAPDQDTLIIADSDTYSLWSYNLGKGEGRILRRNTIVYSMAVHENQNLVFLSTYRPQGLGRMQTDGSGYRVIWRITEYTTSRRVIVSSKQNRLYMSDGYRIISTGLDGNDRNILQRGQATHAISLDEDSQVLYFNSNSHIQSVSLLDGKLSMVFHLHTVPHSMVCFRGRLYISVFRDRQAIIVKDLNNHHERNIPISDKYSHMLLCLIP